MRNWLSFLAKRLAFMAISLWTLITITFLLVTLLPSDPARTVVGEFSTEENYQRVVHELGLDLPIWMRYFNYIGQLFHGDLGKDIFTGHPISEEMFAYLPATFELIVLSLIFASVFGILLGSLSAYYAGKIVDRISSIIVSIFQALPDFIVGVALIMLLGVYLQWLPLPEGQLSIIATPPPLVTGMTLVDSLISGNVDTFWDAAGHAAIPVLTLGLVIGALFARVTRASLKEALNSDQVKFARACGLSEFKVFHYAFLASRTPILTYLAIVFSSLFGGVAIIEILFNWQGLAQWSIDAMINNNFAAAQGFVLLVGLITLVVYVALDVVAGLLDPRIRLVGKK